MAFSPPVLGCLVKKGLQKGGSRAPQDPPGHALGKKRLIKQGVTQYQPCGVKACAQPYHPGSY